MSFARHPGRRVRAVLVAAGSCAALVLAASAASAQTGTTGPSGRAFANGSVTSVHGTAVQVNNTFQNSESTVTLQPSTEYTKRETAAASAITVGACVRVLGTGSAAKGITAQSVSLSVASASGCAGPGNGGAGAAGGPGTRGGFRFGNGQRPRNFGGNGTGNGSRTRPANFAMAFGPVTSVSGDTLVVKSTTFVRPAATKSKGKAKGASTSKSTSSTTPKTTTSNVTVTLTNTSQISQTVSASASDVTVGSCVTATGTSNGGGVDADRVAISDPVNGQCTGGFGRFGGGGGTGGNGGSGNGQV